VPGVHLAKAKRHRPMPRRFPPPWSVEEQQACDADHRHYCCQGVRNQQLGSSRLGGIHFVAPQELQGRSQVPRIHCDDRSDQLQRLRLRAALAALPEGYRGRAVPHHLRLRAAISGKAAQQG
jgi:hypothetical protein